MEKGRTSPTGAREDVVIVSNVGLMHRDNDAEKENSHPDQPLCHADNQADLPPAETPATQAKREKWGLIPIVMACNALAGVNNLFFSMFYVELVSHFRVPTATIGWPDSINKWFSLFSGITVRGSEMTYTRINWSCKLVLFNKDKLPSFFKIADLGIYRNANIVVTAPQWVEDLLNIR